MTSHVLLWYWKGWRGIYSHVHVNAAARALAAFNPGIRVLCVTNQPKGIICETFPNWDDAANSAKALGQRIDCFKRLRIFSPELQLQMRIPAGDVLYSCDIDSVFLGSLPPLPETSEYAAVRGYHAKYNGSLFAQRAGALGHVYEEYLTSGVERIRKARREGQRLVGSDQAWMSLCIDNGHMWDRKEGVYPWPRLMNMPRAFSANAVLWTFPGAIKPWHAGCVRRTPWLFEAWAKHARQE